MTDFDRDEVIRSMLEEFEDQNETIQEKKGLFSKIILEHLSKICKNKAKILNSLRFTPVINFNPDEFKLKRSSSVVSDYRYMRDKPPVYNNVYFIEVFILTGLNDYTVLNVAKVYLSDLLMKPNNVNEFKAGLECLVDEIAIKTLDLGDEDRYYTFKYEKEKVNEETE
jgi:hypothetical protein